MTESEWVQNTPYEARLRNRIAELESARNALATRTEQLESRLRRIRHAYGQFMEDSCQDLLEGLLHQVRSDTED